MKVHCHCQGQAGVRQARGDLHQVRDSPERGAEHHEPQAGHSGLQLSQAVGEDRSLAVLGHREPRPRHPGHRLAGGESRPSARSAGEVPHDDRLPGRATLHQPGQAGPRHQQVQRGQRHQVQDGQPD